MRFVPPSLRWRTFLAATAAASTLFTGVPASAQYSYSYPACDGPPSVPSGAGCAMLDYLAGQPSSRVMTGAVGIYVLWYGPFSTSADSYLQSLLPYFIASINHSVYEATSTTYSGSRAQCPDNFTSQDSSSTPACRGETT